MTDITKAITAAREALARLREHDGGTRYNGDDDDAGERACCLVASWKPHDSDCPHAVAVAEFDRLLAALGAAQGEAVLGSVQSGSVTIPFWVIDYAQKIELFMKVNGVDAWALGGIQSRDLPPPQAPPIADAALADTQRAIIEAAERRGYERGLREAPPAAVPADGWKEAAIAWEVCASIHRKYAKGRDALFSTRQQDFVSSADKARAMLAAANKENNP